MSVSARDNAAHLLNRFIYVALLGLIILTPIPYGTVEPLWEAIFECAVFALAALWVVEGLLCGSWNVRSAGLLAPPLALAALAFIQTLPITSAGPVSADPYETRLFLYKLLALITAGALLISHSMGRRRLRGLVWVIVVVAVASSLFGIARQVMQQKTGFLLPDLEPHAGYGQFINRNHFAFMMEMALGLVLGLLLEEEVRRDKVLLYLAAAAPLWVGLVFSNSRGGILGMICQVLAAFILILRTWSVSNESARGASGSFFLTGRKFALRAVVCAILMAVLGLGILWVGGDPLVKRLGGVQAGSDLTQVNEEGDSDPARRDNVNRLQIWKSTWSLIKAHPISGVGFGAYFVAIPAHHDASGVLVPQQAHSDYLELLASGGVIAVGLMVWFVYAFVKSARLFGQSRDPFRRAAGYGAVIGLCGVAVHSLFDFGLHITANALICTCLIVIAAGSERRRKGRADAAAVSNAG